MKELEIKDLENSETNPESSYLEWIINKLNKEDSTASMILNFNHNVKEEDVFPAEIKVIS